MNNKKFVNVNLSSSFVVRARCKKCSEVPKYYYYSRLPINWFTPNKNFEIKNSYRKYYKRMCSDSYQSEYPSNHLFKLGYLSWHPPEKGYNPRLHITKGSYPMEFIEILTCSCGGTSWYFLSPNPFKKEVLFRKAMKNFPFKFAY